MSNDYMFRGKPIQLLEETANSFKLNIDALKSVLENDQIKDKHVVLISVAGDMRGGKSFLLDFFLRYLQSEDKDNWLGDGNTALSGFSWKNGDERDTTGILLWSEPHIVTLPSGEECAVLLLDTQGTFDKKSMQKNAMIFALSGMVSSMQIFNVQKQVLEDKLQFLRLFTNYGRLAMPEGQNQEKPFQHLQFLVRDWQNPYKMPYGIGGGSQYLTKLLHVEEDDPAEIIEVRQFIAQCFSRIDCCLMPHPGMKVIISEVFDGRLSDIEPIFVENLAKYVPTILSPNYLLPKAINGEKVTCLELLEYFKSYFKLFNSDDMPHPVDIYKATTEASNMAAVNTCKRHYMEEMDKVCAPTTKYLSEPLLKLEHTRCHDNAIDKFNITRTFGGPQHRDIFRANLGREIEECFQSFVNRNELKNKIDPWMRSLLVFIIWYVIAYMLQYVFMVLGMSPMESVMNAMMYVVLMSSLIYGGSFVSGHEEIRHNMDELLDKSYHCVIQPMTQPIKQIMMQWLAARMAAPPL